MLVEICACLEVYGKGQEAEQIMPSFHGLPAEMSRCILVTSTHLRIFNRLAGPADLPAAFTFSAANYSLVRTTPIPPRLESCANVIRRICSRCEYLICEDTAQVF